jgi:hypothetical protein
MQKVLISFVIDSLEFEFTYFTIKSNRENNTRFIPWATTILSFQGGYINSKLEIPRDLWSYQWLQISISTDTC